MPVPSEIVAQLHRLTWQAKAKKNITFTNAHNEVIDVLYAAIERDEDDVDLAQSNEELAVVDGEDKDNARNED